VLVVTPDAFLAHELADTLEPATVDRSADFVSARTNMAARQYDLIVTELRLGAYNGLHLAYVAKQVQPRARTIVFTAPFDPVLASEAVAAGAFYEHTHRVVAAARGYLGTALPRHDRRDPALFASLHAQFPSGHRAADHH
jgi:DNA-binding NtrC family response regulator